MLFIFDMGGVVTNTFELDSMYKKLNLNKNDFFNFCRDNGNIHHLLEIGEITVPEFWKSFNNILLEKNMKEGTDYHTAKNDLFRMYFHPSKNLKTVELIQNLKKNNRVICGTNTIQSHWENHMERGDYSFFNQTYASNKIGIAKPDPEFFRAILEVENYSPSQTFFTDDKIENCEAAKSVGINAVQFKSAEELTELWKKYY